MDIELVTLDDRKGWIALAAEVEPLFGPMVSDMNFHAAMKMVIEQARAFCIRGASGDGAQSLRGVVVISPQKNEIEWLAVAAGERGKGYGRALLQHALAHLDPNKAVTVQTFAEGVVGGDGARHLYRSAGFVEVRKAGRNPAGIPTVIMRRDGAGLSEVG